MSWKVCRTLSAENSFSLTLGSSLPTQNISKAPTKKGNKSKAPIRKTCDSWPASTVSDVEKERETGRWERIRTIFDLSLIFNGHPLSHITLTSAIQPPPEQNTNNNK